MKVTKAPLRVQPRYQVSESLNLDGKDLLDLRTLNANIIGDMLDETIKRRESLLSKLKK
ncbi:MAG TPA: hypothetical protein VJH22_05280 [Candidatus Nanoarchaeia archaeon]|nr:hypothetical protein [Candidatus Nanoarchaeia archaeon]